MSNARKADSELAPPQAGRAQKRVILSMGGKGGVGKTTVITGLAEWFDLNQIPVKLLDLDSENKTRGSLTHFFNERAPKVNIHRDWHCDFRPGQC
jgi:Mrp family chromosome partitioning ATPase